MKNQFPQFDPGAEVDHKAIWETALFVFDTNVLLNLYRYQSSTRGALLDVLDKISERIWIPHHVALEFQRNRINVISDQNKRFAEVKGVVEKARDDLRNKLAQLQLEKRHSLIDPSALTDGFDKLSADFLQTLEGIQEEQQKLHEPDPLKQKLEDLFDERVGEPPKDQKELDDIYKTAKSRYDQKVPPGYLDANKDRGELSAYMHGGVTYQKKYGDYLIWHQILANAKENKIEALVFVTDDTKDDWWWNITSDGPKTLGPRPELIEEAHRVGKITQFKMYKPGGFLTHSKEYLKTGVSSEAIQEVRDISSFLSSAAQLIFDDVHTNELVENKIFEWIQKQNPSAQIKKKIFPDFIIKNKYYSEGILIKNNTNAIIIKENLHSIIEDAKILIENKLEKHVRIIFVTKNNANIFNSTISIINENYNDLPESISICIGVIGENQEKKKVFIPIENISKNPNTANQ